MTNIHEVEDGKSVLNTLDVLGIVDIDTYEEGKKLYIAGFSTFLERNVLILGKEQLISLISELQLLADQLEN